MRRHSEVSFLQLNSRSIQPDLQTQTLLDKCGCCDEALPATPATIPRAVCSSSPLQLQAPIPSGSSNWLILSDGGPASSVVSAISRELEGAVNTVLPGLLLTEWGLKYPKEAIEEHQRDVPHLKA